ncbi:MAG: hypothetical protein RhofKO_21010 [Rhodothermales bacterium]
MLEFFILLAGTLPLLVGIYAIQTLQRDRNRNRGDQPPPPDPEPPRPILPPSPAPRHLKRLSVTRTDARPSARSQRRTLHRKRTR